MAWSYMCEDDKVRLTANTKEELADKVMQHANKVHNMSVTRQQALDMVNKGARQAA